MATKFKKVGRNDPCPCGSGKKFKHCCLNKVLGPIERRKALEHQRIMQQGHGRPIASELIHGKRLVSVGGKTFVSDRWKTFHDFLQYYIKTVLGTEWGSAELKKSPSERHPLMNWYQEATAYVNRHISTPGLISAMPVTAKVAAYLGLAYNLYLLTHNLKAHDTLVRRLKQRDQFYGAYYEAFVIGALLRAGFDVEFEDETDSTTSHCELTATYMPTGEKFSVEAKIRAAGKCTFDVGNQLYNALRKKALYPRIVFIEVNAGGDGTTAKQLEIQGRVLESIRSREPTLKIDGQPAPPAYVIATNNPHNTAESLQEASAMAEGFKIPDFKTEGTYPTLEAALAARERHTAVTALLKSLGEHGAVPATFDGEVAPFAFEPPKDRLLIGNRYVVPSETGEVEGQLSSPRLTSSLHL
ncbi:MAG: SEC-C metal-binding domain-containing protein [Opitutaceae bacterium]